MRAFSLMFVLISLVMLAMFFIYVFRRPVDPVIAAGLFVSFLACLAPAIFLLKPFESMDQTRARRERRARLRERSEEERGDPPRDPGS